MTRESGVQRTARPTPPGSSFALGEGVALLGEENERRSFIPADSVIVAGPRRPAQELVGLLEFSTDELYIVGDAVRPGSVHNAIRDAFLVGVRI